MFGKSTRLIVVLVFFILSMVIPGNVNAGNDEPVEKNPAEKNPAAKKAVEKKPDEAPMTVSILGDCILGYKVSNYDHPGFKKIVDIIRAADCTLGNCELAICKGGELFPAYKDFDPNVYCDPWAADEFKWLGIDLMGLANNHAMDFDYDGLFATLHHLDRVDIRYAGAGKDLEHATKAGMYESKGGPVALISCTSWLPEKNLQASLSHPYMKGRPGVNPVNVELALELEKEKFDALKKIYDQALTDLGFPDEVKKGKEVKKFKFENSTILKGDKTDLLLIPEKRDIERIVKVIKAAKRNNRIVIVALHEHIGSKKQENPSKFQEDFARTCIDAGADMFCSTGPHQIWGIEIYKGKPIFHSVGNFFLHMPLRIIGPEAYQRFGFPPDSLDPTLYENKFLDFFKSEVFWESFVPVVSFDAKNRVSGIKLYPIELGQHEPFHRRGTPRLANPERAQSIFKRLKKKSKEYKTTIKVKNGIGWVVL